MIAQLTDPHVRVGPGDLGSGAALEAAVNAVLALDPGPEAVIVTGDLADEADAREYARVAELLGAFPVPVHVLPGNHDDPDALRELFAPAGEPGGSYEYATTIGAVRLVGCDTTVPGSGAGALGPERLERLEAELAAAPEAPTIVAMHHPPFLIGIDAMDAIGIPAADRGALREVLAGAPQVRRVIAGHVHRTSFGRLGGCGVMTCAGTNMQAVLEIGGETLRFAPDPPAFALHALVEGEVVSHVQPLERG